VPAGPAHKTAATFGEDLVDHRAFAVDKNRGDGERTKNMWIDVSTRLSRP
jgi:hypothetical protein